MTVRGGVRVPMYIYRPTAGQGIQTKDLLVVKRLHTLTLANR